LKRAGNKVISLDLPGHGRDHTPIDEITLESYVGTLCDALEEEEGRVVLVGHSRGGIVISQAAERRPEKVKMLIYLAAYLIPNGQAMLPIALSDKESLIGQNLELNEAEGWHMIKDSAVRDALYGDCSDEDVELARSLLTREPNAPLATKLALTQANYGSVPRCYIETLKDKGCSIALQRSMRSLLPCQKVTSMNTSHSPFLSAPNELAGNLLSLARS
jgi:pimeloyl-ACP methyl ester carboxylesterase